MGLKQSIVVVNEYSIKNKSSKGGSRGGTPGDYVLRYMARDKAVEDLTPVRLQDHESFITRYMARREASEVCVSVDDEKRRIRDADGLGGIAFGYGDVSLSDAKIRWASKDIQRNFDAGKTVMKTVLSFDEAYLRENKIIDDDFQFKQRGDYRGNIDQMKLRMAIMNGLDKMSSEYDDLQYVGVIQVDTFHVHCHLAMVDRGLGNVTKDGTQRGKLSEKNKRDLRRGIDMFLDEKQKVAMMSSNITNDKRNALCFIKKYTHQTMDEHGIPQLLMACLPEDKTMWRASTNRKEMQKANAIVREYVQQVLEQPDSGFAEARRDVARYADERTFREDLSPMEHRKLIRDGEERIIEDCMNGVYAVLKQIPDDERMVKTPMLDAMSMNYEVMAERVKDDPMIEFGFKLRSYSNRLEHHKKEMMKYHDLSKQYEAAKEEGNVAPASQSLYDFFQEEQQYNTQVMSKYQYFLNFLPSQDKYEDDFHELMEYKHKIHKLDQLKDDPSCKRMKPDKAEDYGLRVYDMHGGRFAATEPQILENRILQMQRRYDEMEEEFKLKLSGYGLSFDGQGVKRETAYDFQSVKALDLHHLGYDWTYDVPISKFNVDNFVEAAHERYAKYQAACEYLRGSDQELMIDTFQNKDIQSMKELADKLSMRPILEQNRTSIDLKHNSRTVKLDTDYGKDMKMAVKLTVQSINLRSAEPEWNHDVGDDNQKE